jgi:hypothetical protein
MICENCGKEFSIDWRKYPKGPARFCSKPCAKATHRKFIEERFCKNCGDSLGAGWKSKNSKYCSSRCQQDFQKKELLQEWLSTGCLPNYTGGQSGNTPRGKYMRELLLEEQEDLCAECHQPAVHNNKPLKFILDHVDGNSTNNARSNLRLICPNCDSQSDTYKGKNKGKGRRSKGFTNKGL